MVANEYGLWGSLQRALWETPIGQHGPWTRIGIRLIQAVYGIARKFVDGQFNHLAASLTYTTLLSLVPMLAVSFSVLKAFGVQNQLQPALHELMEPLGEQGQLITDQIVQFVDRLQVGVLGSVGLIVLFYTVLILIQKIEAALNDIWHVNHVRSIGRRFSDYLSAVLIGPVLVFTLVSLSSRVAESHVFHYLTSLEPLGFVVYQSDVWGSYLIVCGIFAFIYGYIPNTHVKLSAALAGGVFAGILWYTTGQVFANLVVTFTNYSAIYSGLAALILFMIWLYVGWLVVLVGGQIAAYWQHPQLLDYRGELTSTPHRVREELALEVMTLVGSAYYHHQPLWNLEALERCHPELPAGLLQQLLRQLIDRGLLTETNLSPSGLMPARDLETISLGAVLAAVRGSPKGLPGSHPAAAEIMQRLDQAMEEILDGRSVKDLVINAEADSKAISDSANDAHRTLLTLTKREAAKSLSKVQTQDGAQIQAG